MTRDEMVKAYNNRQLQKLETGYQDMLVELADYAKAYTFQASIAERFFKLGYYVTREGSAFVVSIDGPFESKGETK